MKRICKLYLITIIRTVIEFDLKWWTFPDCKKNLREGILSQFANLPIYQFKNLKI